MGVKGWSRFLAEEGWLPMNMKKSQRHETSLWMDKEILDHSHPSFESRLVEIPAGSELHIDGFCLCFQIHHVAYARHYNQVLMRSKTTANKKWKPWQVRHFIPSFLPLDSLTQVTKEFVEALLSQHNLKLLVYWDGDSRYAPPTGNYEEHNNDGESDNTLPGSVPSVSSQKSQDKNDDDDNEVNGPTAFKHETEVFRHSQRMEEWSALQDWCVYGRIPANSGLHEWEKKFPLTRVFISQIMHTLLERNVPMQFCDEEADSIMARAVTGKPHAFILGQDSDFCFFPESSYIPINTLVSEKDSLKAIVMRRDVLADSLDLPDTAMVELAILMGNDYISDNSSIYCPSPPTIQGDDCDGNGEDAVSESNLASKKQLRNRDPRVCIPAYLDLLRSRGEGYQVQNEIPDVQECLVFVRKLYNLQDMSNYQIEKAEGVFEPSLVDATIGMTDHISVELKKATIDPQKGDVGLKDAVVRYLEMLLKHQEESDSGLLSEDGTGKAPVLTQSHIQVFQMMAEKRSPYSTIDKEIQDPNWRPLWKDIPATYWIERLTHSIVQNTIKQQHGQKEASSDLIASPRDMYDPYLYHASLRIARETHNIAEEIKIETTEEEGDVPKLYSETNNDDSKARLKLPVDEFHDEILQSVKKNRVTIIQGDTGCGKSSRIPVMMLNAPPPNPNHKETKLFISQPRRIAAKALVERLRTVEPELKGQIALRMGHGVREYETNQTRAWFVTTGYLVRLLANHPERFDDISILIIDEVHERSVDNDILCLLCRRLLLRNDHIRLVLMSATLAADMYQQYFSVLEPPIRVGARRFPVKEVYLDDLSKEVQLSCKVTKKANDLLKQCLTMKCQKVPSAQYMEKVYQVVANLATVIGKPGTSVLIFVPGMNEIVAITELIESIVVLGIRFKCVPIHSDIPFEDQMLVFDASKDDEVKIVIATNAAESSLTLPEVDSVICLGLCKQIIYNKTSHRQMLTPAWISRASATQRAGRTGRVRPGTVYRMYARKSYNTDMDAFEPGEMLRIPLDSVILMLKEMLSEEEVSEVLLTCLEPPDITAIDRSFQSLYKSHFISSPDDTCELTNLGSFVSALGIDLALGSLIGLGIQMGVGAEATQMAAVLSFPKSPWVMSNPLVHGTSSFNDPLAVMNLIWDYESHKDTHKWAKFHNIFLPRIRRLLSTTINLRKRVAVYLGIPEGTLQVSRPPVEMPHGMITILRIIQVWVFNETMIQIDSTTLQGLQKSHAKNGLSIDIQPQSDVVEQCHLEQLFMKDRHFFELLGSSEIRQKGNFEYIPVGEPSPDSFMNRLEVHLISFAIEKQFTFFCISFTNRVFVYTISGSETEKIVKKCLKSHRVEDSRVTLKILSNEGKSVRGIGERSCGRWTVQRRSATKSGSNAQFLLWSRTCFEMSKQVTKKAAPIKKGSKKIEAAKKDFKTIMTSLEKLGRLGDHKCMVLKFPWASHQVNANQRLKFFLVSFGTTKAMTAVDLRDILGSRLDSTTEKKAGKQKLQFLWCKSLPREFKGGNDKGVKMESSWERPLIKCIPEGARIVSVLVSSRRRDNIIKLVATEASTHDGEVDEDSDLSLFLPKSTNATFRWKRFNTTDAVYIDMNSVPATAVPVDSPDDLYCVCANALEVRGGGLRAEGLTLLPQGKVFLLLARFTFGLLRETNIDDDTILDKAMMWIGSSLGKAPKKILMGRIERAINFHKSSLHLGETLECFPEKVKQLLEIFDGIDGYEAKAWETLSSNPPIRQNVAHLQSGFQEETGKMLSKRQSSRDKRDDVKINREAKEDATSEGSPPDQVATDRTGSGILFVVPDYFSTIPLSQKEKAELRGLFENDDELTIGSCKTLAEVVQNYRGVGEQIFMESSDWEMYSVQMEGKHWFKAVFKPHNFGYTERPKKSNCAAWMKKKDHITARPRTVGQVTNCIPPKYQKQVLAVGKKNSMKLSPDLKHIVFDDMKLAVQMEAAFWLERQLGSKKRHWYQFGPNGLAQMVWELKHPRAEHEPGVQQCSKNAVKKSKSKKLMEKKMKESKLTKSRNREHRASM